MLTFDNSENTEKVFDIRHLQHMKINVEAIKSGKQIPQCKLCQRYGHTKKFCRHKLVCVKCAGNHVSTECTLPKESPARCSNCRKSHPCNYCGCVVAKELPKRRNVQSNKQQKPSQKTFTSNKVVEGVSYSQMAAPKSQPTQPNPMQTKQLSLKQLMYKMMTRMDEFSQRLAYIEARKLA